MYCLFLIVFFLIVTAPVSNAQTSNFETGREDNRHEASHIATNQNHAIKRSRASFVVSRIDEQVVREFERAWDKSEHGILSHEALVLIFRMPDNSIRAVPGGLTNEAYKFTFQWNQAIFAIVHTHPNKTDPKPQAPDLSIADRFGVPIFTITLGGMYLYDPVTRKITKVQDGLDWLKPTSWARYSNLLNNQIARSITPPPSIVAERPKRIADPFIQPAGQRRQLEYGCWWRWLGHGGSVDRSAS